MFFAKDKIKNLTNEQIKLILRKSLCFCVEELGDNKRKFPPKILLMDKHERKKYCGMYDPYENIIFVYVDSCKTISSLTSTIIHEYTHYLQPILSKYAKLLNKHGYEDHPHEIEAYGNEKKFNRKLLNYLRK